MARLLFEEQGVRTRRGSLATGVAFVFYTDAAGTVLADISATAEVTATSTSTVVSATSTVTVADIAGLGPAAYRFYGPDDDTDKLYLRCPADLTLGVQEIQAAPDPRLDVLEAGGGGSHPNLAVHDALGLATDAELTAHAADTTSIHGITDTSVLATTSGVASSIITHSGALDPHADRAYARAYADSVAQGLDVKLSVRVASTANLTLSGEQTIDGVLTSADRVLVKNQTTGAENGIYVSAAGAWARAVDADVSAEVSPGSFTFVEEGTVNGGTGWVQATPDPITLGATALVFTQFSGAGTVLGGAGLLKTGNTLDVGAGTGITVAADTVGIATGGVTNTQVSASAGIAESKLALNFPTHAIDHASRHAAAGADPLTGYVLTGDHTAAAHDTFGLATDAELAAHGADTTAIHGITDTSQVAIRNAANTFTADNLFRSGRPWIDVRAYGTDTTAIDTAFAAAQSLGAPLYFPKGADYTYGGTGLDGDTLLCVGAGQNSVVITLSAGVYLFKPSGSLTQTFIEGLYVVGGKGLIHHTRTTANVTRHHVIQHCRFDGYTECAIATESVDMPYWRITDNDFFAANDDSTIGIALGVDPSGGVIRENSFRRNRIDVKFRGAGLSASIENNDFIQWDAAPSAVRARVWYVPTATPTNAGDGAVVRGNKFGNEGQDATDKTILYADEDGGADNATKMPVLSSDSTGYVVGHHYSGNKFSGGAAAVPLIYSTTPNVEACQIGPNHFDGTAPTYLLEYRTTPSASPERQTNRLGPALHRSAITPASNAAFHGPAITGRAIRADAKRRASTSLVINGTSFVDFDTALDITLAARVGDRIEASVSGLWLNEAVNGCLDMATVVSASPVTYFSSGTGTPATDGVIAWLGPTSTYHSVGGPFSLVLVSGDITAAGQVLLRLRVKTETATNKTMMATAALPFVVTAKNLGPG